MFLSLFTQKMLFILCKLHNSADLVLLTIEQEICILNKNHENKYKIFVDLI